MHSWITFFVLTVTIFGQAEVPNTPDLSSSHHINYCAELLKTSDSSIDQFGPLMDLLWFWDQRYNSVTGFTKFKREKLSDQVIKDLELTDLELGLKFDMDGHLFEDKASALMDSFRGLRLHSELTHPLVNAAEINQRLDVMAQFARNPLLVTRLNALYEKINQFSKLTWRKQWVLQSVLQNSLYFEFVERIRWQPSVNEHERVSTPLIVSALALYFAPPTSLSLPDNKDFSNLDGFAEGRTEIRNAVSNLLQEMRKIDTPLMNELRTAFEVFENPELIDVAAPVSVAPTWKFWQRPDPKATRQAAQDRAVGRLRALSSTILALEELDFMAMLTIPHLEKPNQFSLPVIDDSKTAALEIVDGHDTYILRLRRATSVPNSLILGGNTGNHAQILEGPNRRGKTIYLKMVGTLVLLARIGAYVPARSMKTSVFSIMTSLDIRGSRAGSESQFSAESRLGAEYYNSLQADTSMAPHLLLADEFFHGTTPRQQMENTRVLIRRLKAKNTLVILTSQTPELQDEGFEGTQMIHNTSDYKVVPGKAKEEDRNATVIMRETGWPTEFTDEVDAGLRK